MPRLRVRDGASRGLVCPIGEKPLILGRETDCNIQIMDQGASRHHAQVFRVGEMCFIRDMASRNGTYVNDEAVKEELLREGDRIGIGAVSLVFEAAPPAGDARDIMFTEATDEELGSTLELRLDDLAGLEEEEEDRDAANFRAIYQLGRMLGSERDVEEAQEKALAFLAELVPAEQVYLFSRDPQTGSFVPGARYERDAAVKAQVSRSIIKRCLSEHRSIMTTNAMSDARFRGNESVVLKRIRSVICVPMVSQGSLSGALYISSSRLGEPFVEEDLELVTAAATLLGLTTERLESARRQRETLFSAMRALVAVGEAGDEPNRGHSERVASFAQAMALQLALPERVRTSVRLAALLHDIGKSSVPDEVLAEKDTKLLRRGDPATLHAIIGARVAGSISGAEDVAPAIRHHHEAFDGSGYPDGLAGEAIPVGARIVAAADELDHLTRSDGHGGAGVGLDVAVDLLQTKAGRELDPEVVRACSGAHGAGFLSEPSTLFEKIAPKGAPPERGIEA